ncbi:MAG: hypothetical protein ABIV51_12535 [Saprospiraceae bacterium]
METTQATTNLKELFLSDLNSLNTAFAPVYSEGSEQIVYDAPVRARQGFRIRAIYEDGLGMILPQGPGAGFGLIPFHYDNNVDAKEEMRQAIVNSLECIEVHFICKNLPH